MGEIGHHNQEFNMASIPLLGISDKYFFGFRALGILSLQKVRSYQPIMGAMYVFSYLAEINRRRRAMLVLYAICLVYLPCLEIEPQPPFPQHSTQK